MEDFLNRAIFCLYLGNRAVHVFSSEYPPDFSEVQLWLWTHVEFLYSMGGVLACLGLNRVVPGCFLWEPPRGVCVAESWLLRNVFILGFISVTTESMHLFIYKEILQYTPGTPSLSLVLIS